MGLIFSFSNRLYFFRKVLCLQKNWVKGVEFSHTSCPHIAQPMLSMCALEWYIHYSQWTCIGTWLLPNVWSTLGFVHSVSFDKCIRIYIHHYIVTLNLFIALKNCVPPNHSSLPPAVDNYWFILLSP